MNGLMNLYEAWKNDSDGTADLLEWQPILIIYFSSVVRFIDGFSY